MSSQIEPVLEMASHVPEPEENELTVLEPRVPFRSDLVLTREQEDRLVEHCATRITELENELGRNYVRNDGWFQDGENLEKGKNTWMGEREMFEAVYRNDVKWRPYALGGIFQKSNLVVPLARRITRQMVARANNYFFATDPWFAAEPEHMINKTLAEKIDQYARFKLQQSGSRAQKEDAIELAFVRGESVVKTVFRRRRDWYQTTAEILVDVEGEPVLDSRGGYVFSNDRWGPLVLVDEATGEEEVVPDIAVLERDPSVRLPQTPLWERRRIRQSILQFSGAESGPVYFKDFLCPLKAKSVEEADIAVHLYDLPIMELAETYRAREILTDEETDSRKDESDWEATKRAVDVLRELAKNDGSPKSAFKGGDSEHHLQRTTRWADGHQNQDADPIISLAECHIYFDADGDGIREHIMVVMDREQKIPIFYDYEANITPDGKRPFTVVRPNSVDGCWYGVGAMEMFKTTQEIVDLQINRWNFSQSKAGRVTFWNPRMTVQGERDPNLKLNDGGVYTPLPNAEVEKILSYVNLPDVKYDAVRGMFEFFLQIAMNESGIQHANDANMAGLDQAKLATGIRNIEKSGMEMFSLYIAKLEPGIQETLTKEINLIFANLEEEEVFSYFAGDDQGLMSITPEEVRDLDVKVRVLLTRYKGEQIIQQATAGINAVKDYYSIQHPLVQQHTAPLFQMFIRALDLPVDPKQIIQPLGPLTGPDGMIDPDLGAAAASPRPEGQPPPNL